jgi:acyl-CoA thioester hydrolase
MEYTADGKAKITESRAIVRFQDCDPLGHLNNAKYFDYFFNARDDQVPQVYGINLVDLFRKSKNNWVVYQQQIAYLQSVMPGEWIRVFSSMIYVDEDTTVTEYYMTDDQKTSLKAVLWTISKSIDVHTGKKSPHPEEVKNFLLGILRSDVDFPHLSFNERIKGIKLEIKNL